MSNMEPRLDASESVFFKREMESIDSRVYEHKFGAYKARRLIPTQDGVDESARVYTYRMFKTLGSAKLIANMADDLPRAEADGTEHSTLIKPLGASYGYDIFEIKAAARQGRPLDSMSALGARRAVEEKIDEILALGDTKTGMLGLLGLSGTTTFTPSTKAAGGLTWGTLAAPNATGAEVAGDVMGLLNKLVEATQEVFNRFRVLLPVEQYNYMASVRIGATSDTTALDFVKKTSPYLESIEPWFRCNNAVSGTTDRMCAYPADSMVVAALVPMEYSIQAPQQRNLEYVINGLASCGGVVCRYPTAIGYADGI